MARTRRALATPTHAKAPITHATTGNMTTINVQAATITVGAAKARARAATKAKADAQSKRTN